jgi:hypothetical protein
VPWARSRAVGVAFIYAITYNYIKVSVWGSRAHGVDVDRLGPGPLRRSHRSQGPSMGGRPLSRVVGRLPELPKGGEVLVVGLRFGLGSGLGLTLRTRLENLLALGGLSSHLNML